MDLTAVPCKLIPTRTKQISQSCSYLATKAYVDAVGLSCSGSILLLITLHPVYLHVHTSFYYM